MKVQTSLACWPGLRYDDAPLHLTRRCSEPCSGPLHTDHVQLVPQSRGLLDESVADRLMAALPHTQFRLHANVRVLPGHGVVDLSGFEQHADWFRQAARLSRYLNAPAYTAHAGRRQEATLPQVLEFARRCAQWFGCPVGIEGHYPTREDAFLLSSWDEYKKLLHSGVPYALDLSHMHILASRSGRREPTLLAEMLSCERCLEVHISDNDGRADQHRVCTDEPWWWPLLSRVHAQAVVFSEGNHRKERSAP